MKSFNMKILIYMKLYSYKAERVLSQVGEKNEEEAKNADVSKIVQVPSLHNIKESYFFSQFPVCVCVNFMYVCYL